MDLRTPGPMGLGRMSDGAATSFDADLTEHDTHGTRTLEPITRRNVRRVSQCSTKDGPPIPV